MLFKTQTHSYLMLYLVLLALIFSQTAHGNPFVDDVSQLTPRSPSSPLAYQRSLLAKINYLQRQNDELTKSVQESQVYRDWILILEKKVTELEQINTQNNSNFSQLQQLIRFDRARIQQLEQEKVAANEELKNSQLLIDEAKENSQALQKQLQENKYNVNQLKQVLDEREQQLQKTQVTLTQLQQEKQIADQRVERALQVYDQNTKKYAEQMALLNEQLQGKTRSVKDLYAEMDALNSKYAALNKAKIISDQQLKRLQSSEAECQKALKACMEKESQDLSGKKDSTATLDKWRKDYDLLKSQLDVALSINKELREQNAQLEKECKTRHPL